MAKVRQGAMVEVASESPSVEAASKNPPVEAASENPPVEAASENPPVEAASENPLVKAASKDPLVKAASKDPLVNAWLDQEIAAQLEKQLKERWLKTGTLLMTAIATVVGVITSWVMTPTVMKQLGNTQLEELQRGATEAKRELDVALTDAKRTAAEAKEETRLAEATVTQARRRLADQNLALEEAFDRIVNVRRALGPVEAGLESQKNQMDTVIAQVKALSGAVTKLGDEGDPSEVLQALSDISEDVAQRAANARTRVSILYWPKGAKQAKQVAGKLIELGYVAWTTPRGKAPIEGAAARVFFRKSAAPFKVSEAQRDEVAEVANLQGVEFEAKNYLTSGDIQIQLATAVDRVQ